MFDNLNGWEIVVLILLGLFIFGPERLPKVIGDAMRMIRNLRDMARNATNDLSREIGTDVQLEDLHPHTFIRKHLLSDEDERDLRRPFDDMYNDVRKISSEAGDIARQATAPAPERGVDPGGPTDVSLPASDHGQLNGSDPKPGAHRYDADAT